MSTGLFIRPETSPDSLDQDQFLKSLKCARRIKFDKSGIIQIKQANYVQFHVSGRIQDCSPSYEDEQRFDCTFLVSTFKTILVLSCSLVNTAHDS